MKICASCKLPKDFDCFYRQGVRKSRAQCISCLNRTTSDRQRANKRRAVELLGGKCSRCGYSKCLGALEFHHIKPQDKSKWTYSGLKNRTWIKILEEIKKCILLCSNCHREEEERLRLEAIVEQGVPRLSEEATQRT